MLPPERTDSRRYWPEFFIWSRQARFIWSWVIPEFIACWLAMQSFMDWCLLLVDEDDEDEDELLG